VGRPRSGLRGNLHIALTLHCQAQALTVVKVALLLGVVCMAEPGVVEMPACPRGHVSRSVVFAGLYGTGLNRQRYRCVPADGSKRNLRCLNNPAGHPTLR
jgi:hypothetical protein